ncbi:MAG: AAA family ATPase, partial [Myxococcales bacterium]|nr:AAA family ATPase [Myxococcales bacterium]
MDPATLIALQAALASSPNNHDLLSVVCAALLESGDARRALEHLDRAELGQLDRTGHRVTFAKVLYESGQFERALGLLDGASELTPDLFLVKARVLDRLDRQEDAQKAYARAIHANPTLQDVELEQRLAAFAAKPQGNGPRLRVISNDDTSDADVVRFIAPDAKKLKFDDVGGLSDVKRQIEKRIILPFKKPSLFQKFKKRVGGGILMYGPTGCGKTLLARATAGECDASFINVAIADILDMYIGESERKLSAIFARARASTPTVL